MAVETFAVRKWIYELLSQDASLNGLIGDKIYHNVAEPSAQPPYVIYSVLSSDDVTGIGSFRIMNEATVLVKAVGEGASTLPLKDVVNRIDEILHGASGAADGHYILGCEREKVVEYSEYDQGRLWHYVGCQWRIYVK
jgi:hypothetical protein